MKAKFLNFSVGRWFPFLFIFLFLLNSCKKDEVTPVLTQEQKWSKEVFTAMQSIYLWNDALPATLDPAKYSTTEKALEYLTGLKINSTTGNAIDHYSFLDKIGNLSGEISQGTASGDYGFMVTA